MSTPPPSTVEAPKRGELACLVHIDDAPFLTTGDPSLLTGAAPDYVNTTRLAPEAGMVAMAGVDWGHGTNGIMVRDPKAVQLHQAWLDTCQINDGAGNIANQGWAAADHQMRIIESEFNELKTLGVAARNIHELRDGIGDLLFTVVGLAFRCGLDSIGDFAEVVRANQSKFDYTERDAALTVEKYAKLSVKVYQKVDDLAGGIRRWVTFADGDQHPDENGKPKYIHGKWLKSHNFRDVEFDLLPMTNRLVAELHPESEPLEAVEIDADPRSSSSEACHDAAAVIAVAGPVEVITNFFKTNEKFCKAFVYYLAAHAKGVLEHQLAKGQMVLRNGEEATSDRLVEIAYNGAWQFLHNLLASGSPVNFDTTGWAHMHSRLEQIKGLEQVDRLLLFVDMVRPLESGADRVAASRSFESLGTSLATDIEWAGGWHDNLTTFYDGGVTWSSCQLIAAAIMQSLFNIDSMAVLLERQQSPESETAAFLMGQSHEIRQLLDQSSSAPATEATTNEA